MSEEIKLFEKAKNLHFSGKIKEAQKLYLKLIKNHKDNHILNYLLGTTFLQIENYYEAIKYFDLGTSIELPEINGKDEFKVAG